MMNRRPASQAQTLARTLKVFFHQWRYLFTKSALSVFIILLFYICCSWVYCHHGSVLAPKVPLLDEESLKDTRVIVIMHYRRTELLTRTLQELLKLPGIDKYRLVITQSVDEDMREFAEPVKHLLNGPLGAAFLSTHHVETKMVKQDQSFSTNRVLYGSKLNSFKNLMNGLRFAFEAYPKLKYATVIEDDTVFSPDMLHFFDKCKSLMEVSPKIAFATTYSLYRPGHHDRPWYMTLSPLHPSPLRFRRLEFDRRIVFKTFSWLVRRSAYEMMATQADAILDPTLDQVHPLFNGCWYCENYCYDHYVEWLFKDKFDFLAPEIPRATQISKGGMTETAEEATTNEYNHEMVVPSQFVDGEPAMCMRRSANYALLLSLVWLTGVLLLPVWTYVVHQDKTIRSNWKRV